jgi:hypothetical protein
MSYLSRSTAALILGPNGVRMEVARQMADWAKLRAATVTAADLEASAALLPHLMLQRLGVVLVDGLPSTADHVEQLQQQVRHSQLHVGRPGRAVDVPRLVRPPCWVYTTGDADAAARLLAQMAGRMRAWRAMPDGLREGLY